MKHLYSSKQDVAESRDKMKWAYVNNGIYIKTTGFSVCDIS